MTLERIRELLAGDILTSTPLDTEVAAASASDLLSDVLAFTPPESLLLTGLVSPQAVRSADLVDAVAVCFVAGMQPEAGTIELAEAMGIALMSTRLSMFDACGLLYAQGLRGGGQR